MTIANLMTTARFVLIPVMWLLVLYNKKMEFLVVFVLAGITDLLDGFFARKFKQESSFGAKLDSTADLTLLISSIFWVFILFPEIKLYKVSLLIFFAIVLLGGVVRLVWRKTLASPYKFHMYSGKFAVVLFYVFFISSLVSGFQTILFYSFILVASFSVLEESYINIKKKFNPNTRSLWHF